jgi:hypothetical protein
MSQENESGSAGKENSQGLVPIPQVFSEFIIVGIFSQEKSCVVSILLFFHFGMNLWCSASACGVAARVYTQ